MKPERTLKDYMLKMFQQLEMTDLATQVEVEQAYHRLVGSVISSHTMSIRYQSGTLYLTVVTAALRQELTMRRTGLMDKINEQVGKNAVKRIVVR